MKSKCLDEFLADEDRASKIIINGAAWATAIPVALAIMAIAWM